MAITITIAGTDRTTKMVEYSARYSDVLLSRNTLDVRFRDLSGGFRPTRGQEVKLLEGATTHFAGLIAEDPIEESEGWNSSGIGAYLNFEVRCGGYELICDRRMVARTYTSQTLSTIVLDIVAIDLALEGITTAGVETGPTITELILDYISVTAAFNRLAELAGMAWWIDTSKVLQFRARSSLLAPITLTIDKTITCRVIPAQSTYRNKQFVRAGLEKTDSRTESFIGDGTRKTFNLAFPIAAVPSSITVNAVAKTIGIRGVETGKDFYWNKGSTEISQDDGATALTTSQTLAVTYQGEYPIIVSAQDDLEIAARKTAEGGTGIYEEKEDRPDINEADAAVDVAKALLERHRLTKAVEFTTLTTGLLAGQLLPLDLSVHNLTGVNYLIESVEGSEHPKDSTTTQILYTVRALSHDSVGGWQRFYRRLVGTEVTIPRANEVLHNLRTFTEAMTLGQSLTFATAGVESRVGTALVGYSEVGA